MTRPRTLPAPAAALLLALAGLTLACDGAQPDDSAGDPGDECVAETLEDDATLDPRLGEAGDPTSWPAMPPDAVVASTYLRLPDDAEATMTFDELVGPIFGELMAPAPGLLGLSTSSSTRCGAVRTLSVWESEEAMMSFVTSDAHLTAMGRVAEVSRGGSITDHWAVDELPALTWEDVVARFREHDGPVY